jgi:hypothetical protein
MRRDVTKSPNKDAHFRIRDRAGTASITRTIQRQMRQKYGEDWAVTCPECALSGENVENLLFDTPNKRYP